MWEYFFRMKQKLALTTAYSCRSDAKKIPPAYVKRVECFNGASLCQSCILRSHASHDKLWHVYIKMVDNKLCFEKGWGDFVRDNSLEFGDFLLFRYAGNLQFVVEIYDTTCCEKEVRTQENNCKPAGVVKRNTGPVTRSKTFSRVDVISSDHGHGENGAIEAATKFLSKSKYPSFKIVMRPAYMLKGSLRVPSGFLTHMKSGIRNLKIEVLDNSWEVRLLAASLRGRLTGGWRQCARDNSLQLDDVCVFELINKNDSVLRLSIFRNNMMK